jgi:hypothetical protein
MVVKAVKIPYGVGETELVILKKRAIALSVREGRSLFQQLSQFSEIPEQHSLCRAFSGHGFKRLLELSCFNYSLDHINSFLKLQHREKND